MAWSLSYRPKPASYPGATIVEGNTGPLELVDDTLDGGISLRREYTHSSGRRVKAESVPEVIRFGSKRKLLDYETARRKTVSDRFRQLIEEIEPGIHQFESVQFIAKTGEDLGNRWFWQVCNRLDTVHAEKSENFIRTAVSWRASLRGEPKLVFSKDAIGETQFWHDKHFSGGPFVSNAARDRIVAEAITGTHFKHYDEA